MYKLKRKNFENTEAMRTGNIKRICGKLVLMSQESDDNNDDDETTVKTAS